MTSVPFITGDGEVVLDEVEVRVVDDVVTVEGVLLWRAMQGLAAEGVRCLDLGLVDSESGQDRARFKLGAGAQAMPLGGTWLRRLLP